MECSLHKAASTPKSKGFYVFASSDEKGAEELTSRIQEQIKLLSYSKRTGRAIRYLFTGIARFTPETGLQSPAVPLEILDKLVTQIA